MDRPDRLLGSGRGLPRLYLVMTWLLIKAINQESEEELAALEA